MNKRCLILDRKNNVLCSGDICFEGMTRATIQPDYKSLIKKIRKNECVRFQIKEKYDEIYDSVLDKYDDEKIYISRIKNISEDLKEDLRVQVSYMSDIMYDPDQCRNISIDMCFLCRISLAMEINYQIIMPWTVEPLIIDFKILRKMDTIGDKEFVYTYGCKFLKINHMEESMLREGVFRFQSLKYKAKKKQADEEES